MEKPNIYKNLTKEELLKHIDDLNKYINFLENENRSLQLELDEINIPNKKVKVSER